MGAGVLSEGPTLGSVLERPSRPRLCALALALAFALTLACAPNALSALCILDGTARGGVLVAAAEQYGLPIHAIGVGEKIDDLRPFDPDLVARVIAGVA